MSMNLLGSIDPPNEAPKDMVDRCETEPEAILMTWLLRRNTRLSQGNAADRLHIDRGVFSRMLAGQCNIPPDRRVAFMWLCGNTCLHQYEARALKVPETQEIAALEARLQKLKGAA